MRRFTLLSAFLALALCADDKPDARQKAVDDIAAKVAKMNGAKGADVFKLMDEVRDASDAFAAANAPAGSALAIASSDGKLVLIAGGKGPKDGVSVVVANPPKGRKLRLRGGDGGAGGHAGRSAAWSDGEFNGESGANGAGSRGGRGGAFSVASAGASVSGSTGANGENAEQGGKNDLPDADGVKAIAESTDAIENMWDNTDKRRALLDTLELHHPARGAVACYSSNGKLLVLIGASGDDRNPDGVSVEVAGKPAEHIVVIAGDAGKNGKPGVAKAPEGALTVNGE